MNISIVNDCDCWGYASLLHLKLSDLVTEEPIVSRNIVADALSSLRVPLRYHRSIVEIILRDARASANAKVLNLWVKVYMDINDLGHSDREEDMDSDIEEEDIDSDTEEDMDSDTEEVDIDSDTEEDMDSAAVLIAHHVGMV